MNWRKIVGWTLASLMALIVIGAVAGYFYLRSSGFQEFAMRKIIAQADQSTGGRTQIRAFDFNLFDPDRTSVRHCHSRYRDAGLPAHSTDREAHGRTED